MQSVHQMSLGFVAVWLFVGFSALTGAMMVVVGMFEDLLAIIRFYAGLKR